MAQYCRYCEHVSTGMFACKCRITGKYMHRQEMKHTNTCKHFQLNPVDALRENVKGYKPNGRKIVQHGGLGKQITIQDVLEAQE